MERAESANVNHVSEQPVFEHRAIVYSAERQQELRDSCNFEHFHPHRVINTRTSVGALSLDAVQWSLL